MKFSAVTKLYIQKFQQNLTGSKISKEIETFSIQFFQIFNLIKFSIYSNFQFIHNIWNSLFP